MKLLAVAGIAAGLLLGGLAAPAPVLGGCQCSGCKCVSDPAVSQRCKCEGLLCSTGGGGSDCSKPDAGLAGFDGTLSEPTQVVATAPDGAILTRRSCDGVVVKREYSAALAAEMREATQSITV